MSNTNNNYSGFGRRLIAYIADYALLSLPFSFALLGVAVYSQTVQQLITNIFLFLAVLVFPAFFLPIVYYTYCLHMFGATLGKMASGIKVQTETGEFLTPKRAFFRSTIGYGVSSLLLGMGYFVILKHPKKQSWHDQLVGTVVTKTAVSWIFGLLLCLFLIGSHVVIVSNAVAQFANKKQLGTELGQLFSQLQTEFDKPVNSLRNDDSNLENMQKSTPDYFATPVATPRLPVLRATPLRPI